MMLNHRLLKEKILALSLFLLLSCDGIVTSQFAGSGEWLIPKDEVHDGGPGKDGIPAVNNPLFADVSVTNYLSPSDRVIVSTSGDEIKIYPHQILDWHEIVNDDMGNQYYSITYCPLTGSGISWNRQIDGNINTFGVSGLLFNTNLIPYDRKTDSNWSQMKMMCVNGILNGRVIETFPVIETSWQTARFLFPEARVMTRNTGYTRNYDSYPYGDYRTNNNALYFPIAVDDARLPRKERVLGIIVNDKAMVFRFADFAGGTIVKNIQFENTPFVIIGSKERDLLIAFQRKVRDGRVIRFSADGDQGIKDDQGNSWNYFGVAQSGSAKGEQLKMARGYIAYWFAWATFWPGVEIYQK